MIGSSSLAQAPISASILSVSVVPDFIASAEAFFLLSVSPAIPITSFNSAGIPDEDLLELWKSVTDPDYHRPILEKPDGGRAFIEASLAIYKFASDSLGASTQSLYLRPWSGQTADPSGVAALASGQLQIEREPSDLFPAWLPIVFQASIFYADHVGTDWGPDGPVEFLSGRRYFVSETRSLGPGELGPLLVPAAAEKPGASYNLPGPGTIRGLTQPGTGLANSGAVSSAPAPGTNRLVLGPQPDLITPAQIGQYVSLTAPSAVAGQVRRLVACTPPADSSTGGTVQLDAVGVFAVSSIVGSFRAGEDVVQAATGAHGSLVAVAHGCLALEATAGLFAAGSPVAGTYSGATASLDRVLRACELPAASGVSWQVLDWMLDVGLTVSNPAPFVGGRLPILEELGDERGVPRSSGESQETYRARVVAADDVVSPNALRRAANRVLATYGGSGCYRQVGSAKLPGLFFDVPPDGNPAHAFAFDLDPTVRHSDRWKVLLNYRDFRAFFLMGVPRLGLDDFSLYADQDPGFDAESLYCDGYAVTDAALHSAVFAGLARAAAGGVGFDLYIEADGCV